MRRVTMHTAETELLDLIEGPLPGEEVVIAEGTMPGDRFVPRRPQHGREAATRDVWSNGVRARTGSRRP